MIDLRQELQKQIQEQLDITLFVKSIFAQNTVRTVFEVTTRFKTPPD